MSKRRPALPVRILYALVIISLVIAMLFGLSRRRPQTSPTDNVVNSVDTEYDDPGCPDTTLSPKSRIQAYREDIERIQSHNKLHDQGYAFDEQEEDFHSCAHDCFRYPYVRFCIRECDKNIPPAEHPVVEN